MAKQKNPLPKVGDIWGNRLVIGEVYRHWKTSKQYVQLECMDCGLVQDVRVDVGRGRSCTCILADNAVRKHGSARRCGPTRLYRIWCAMKSRCSNPLNDHYHRYGGRGIKYCEEWQEFTPFKNWALDNGYQDDLEIDRIDNNGDYEPGNCRWVTRVENARNK